MKHISLFSALLIVFVSCSAPEPIEFPDPNLATAVREALGCPLMNQSHKRSWKS